MNLTYDQFRLIFLVGAGLAILFLLVTVILFFALRIPSVIGDLSGATARKAIENIRNQNESTGDKVYKTSPVNRERGKLTDKISSSGRLLRDPSHSLYGAMATEKIGTQNLDPNAASNETTVLDNAGSNETTVLIDMPAGNETGRLSMGMPTSDETSKLTVDTPNAYGTQGASIFEIEYEITLIHTNEVIA